MTVIIKCDSLFYLQSVMTVIIKCDSLFYLQSVMTVIIKCNSLFYLQSVMRVIIKCDSLFYLQSVMTVIIKCDSLFYLQSVMTVIIKCDSLFYLQSVMTVIIKCDSLFYYIKFSGIPSDSKLIKALFRQWRYHFYLHMCDIIFDQSARSIFTRCQALVVFRRVFRRFAVVWSFGSFELVFSRVEVMFIP